MNSTIDFIRQLNAGSIGLRSEWLARLQMVAENASDAELPEVIVVESANGTPDFSERLETPAVIVPKAEPASAKFEVVGDFGQSDIRKGELPDTVVAPVASPSVPDRDRPMPQTEPAPDDKTKLDIVDLQEIADVRLRLDQAHQPVVRIQKRNDASTESQSATNSPSAAPTSLSRSEKDIKRIVDRIVSQYPPIAPTIIQFISVKGDEQHKMTVAKIATELASRTNEQILNVDAIRDTRQAHGYGLAEIINRDEKLESVLNETEIENLKLINAGRGELTNRKTRPLALTKMAAEFRKSFQYVCVASPDSQHVLTRMLGRYCDVSFLIVDLQSVDQENAQHQVNILRRAGARLGGCIVRQAVEAQVQAGK